MRVRYAAYVNAIGCQLATAPIMNGVLRQNRVYMVALIYKVFASILDAFWMTHLHYCQRTTASENWFLRPAGYDLETDRKRDKWLNGKALNRTARRGRSNSLMPAS